MSSPTHLYHIKGFHFEPDDDPAKWWLDRHEKELFCDDCYQPLFDNRPIDVCLKKRFERVPLSKLSGLSVGYAHVEFLEQFGWRLIEDHFYLGRLLDAKEQPMGEYRTFKGKGGRLLLRGEISEAEEYCRVCLRNTYVALPMESHYVVGEALSGAPIYESDWHQLVITEDLLAKIDQKKWPDLEIIKLPVLENPLDGLPKVLPRFRPQ